MSKYEVFQSSATKEWYFHLRARNGQKVGLEGYKRKAGALKAIKRFQESGSVPIMIHEPVKKP